MRDDRERALRALLPTDEWVRRYHHDVVVYNAANACAHAGDSREMFLDRLAGWLADDRERLLTELALSKSREATDDGAAFERDIAT